jgi:hypothetical protein
MVDLHRALRSGVDVGILSRCAAASVAVPSCAGPVPA